MTTGDTTKDWEQLFLNTTQIFSQLGQQQSRSHPPFAKYPQSRNPYKYEDDITYQEGDLLGTLFEKAISLLLVSTSVPLSKEDSLKLVTMLCTIVRDRKEDEQVYTKFCQFLVGFLRKQQILFNRNALDEVLDFLLIRDSNAAKKGHAIHLDTLRALSYVLFENGSRCSPIKLQQLIAYLVPLAHPSNPDKESQRLTINCLGNLCTKGGSNIPASTYALVYDVLYHCFELYSQEVKKNSSFCKILSSTLRSLQYVIAEGKNLQERHLKTFLEVLKELMCYGTNLNPSPAKDVPQVRKPKGERTLRDPEYDRGLSSDSEQSDSESAPYDRFCTWKVRLHALTCVAACCRSSPKSFYAYWPSLLPGTTLAASKSTSPRRAEPSLLTVIRHDPSPKVRMVGTTALSTMLDGSRSYLASAEESSKSGSFISFSQQLGTMVREIHIGLLSACDFEANVSCLNQIIKSIAVLVINAPYERLAPGLFTAIITRLQLLLLHPEHTVKIQALACLAATVSTRTPSKEVESLLLGQSSLPSTTSLAHALGGMSLARSPPTSPHSPPALHPVPNAPMLMKQLLEMAQQAQEGNPLVRTELFQVFGAIAKTYYAIFSACWDDLYLLLMKALGDTEDTVRLYAFKVIEEYTKAAAVNDQYSRLLLWKNLFESRALTSCFEDNFHSVRSIVATWLSHMSAEVFDSLGADRKKRCLDLILSMANDVAPSVRAAAARTLGVYILFPSLYSNSSFVTNAISTLMKAMNDNTLNVRIRACWSIGNLCDALTKLPPSMITDELPPHILMQLARCALRATNDNDKVRSNAVRALGNFARFAPSNVLFHPTGSLVNQIVEVLVNSSNNGSVKVRWNACYALGSVFQNAGIQQHLVRTPWLYDIFDTLVHVIWECKNFKIRINASLAMSVPPMRVLYGNKFLSVWKANIQALTVADGDVTDFAEYKYKQTLENQIVDTCKHLIRLCTNEDIPLMQEVLTVEERQIVEKLLEKEVVVFQNASNEEGQNLKYQERMDDDYKGDVIGAIKNFKAIL